MWPRNILHALQDKYQSYGDNNKRSQYYILNKLNDYQTAKAKQEKIFLIEKHYPRADQHERPALREGHCKGLASAWLIYIEEAREEEFDHLIEKVLSCSPEKLLDSEQEKYFERLISEIKKGQDVNLYLNKNLEKSYEQAEFALESKKLYSFKVNPTSLSKKKFSDSILAQFLSLPVNERLPILVSGFNFETETEDEAGHAVAIFRSGDEYLVYDSNYRTGHSKKFTDPLLVIKEIKQNCFQFWREQNLSLKFNAFKTPGKDITRFRDPFMRRQYQLYLENRFQNKDGLHRFFAEINGFATTNEAYFYYVLFVHGDREHARELLKRQMVDPTYVLEEELYKKLKNALDEFLVSNGMSCKTRNVSIQFNADLGMIQSYFISRSGQTLFQDAILEGTTVDELDLDFLKELIQYSNIQINTRNIQGRTVAHYLAERSRPEWLNLLLLIAERGADFKIKDNHQLTALDYALKRYNFLAVLIMLGHMPAGDLDLDQNDRKDFLQNNFDLIFGYFKSRYFPSLNRTEKQDFLNAMQGINPAKPSMLSSFFKEIWQTSTPSPTFFQSRFGTEMKYWLQFHNSQINQVSLAQNPQRSI